MGLVLKRTTIVEAAINPIQIVIQQLTDITTKDLYLRNLSSCFVRVNNDAEDLNTREAPIEEWINPL